MTNWDDGADWYAFDGGAEHLSHSSVHDLLEEALDDDVEWPRTVYAYSQMAKPSVGEILSTTSSLVEGVTEWWHDQWGDPEGDGTKGTEAMKSAFYEAVQEWVACQTVWACEVVAEKEFTKEEAEREVQR